MRRSVNNVTERGVEDDLAEQQKACRVTKLFAISTCPYVREVYKIVFAREKKLHRTMACDNMQWISAGRL